MTQSQKPLPPKFLAAMIAVPPLPGSPLYQGDDSKVLSSTLSDLEIYASLGVDCIVLENSHDLPYIKPPLPDEAVSLIGTVAQAIRSNFPGLLGIQLLEAANETALRVAEQAGLDFLRVESYVFAHIGGAGLIEGCAGKLLRLRKKLGCEHIRVFADIKKKHCSHALTGDQDITDEAKQAAFFLADGLIVTGARTAEAPNLAELQKVKQATSLPVLIGSGMTAENIGRYYAHADGFIVGSTFRESGAFLGRLERGRFEAFMSVFRELQQNDR